MKLLPALATTVLLGAGSPPAASDLDPRALMLQARSLQREGGGDNPQGAAAIYRKVVAAVPVFLRYSE